MRISLHLRKIQFRILLEKKKEEKYHSISLILLARSNAVYSNIKFPIVLSINCNLPKEKKKTNSSRKGKSLRYSNEGKKKNKVNAKLNGGRAGRRRGRRRGRRERRDERSKFLSAKNRIREWFMGLHRGRIHRGPPGIFLYSYALSLVFFAPRISLPPSPSPPSASAWGPTPCARNLNPLVIKSGLYATAGLPRAFTYEKVKCIQVEVPIYRAVSADQV